MVRRVVAFAVALLTTAGVALLSKLPYEADEENHALLRLAWRVRGDRLLECRTLTPEELRDVPAHMRRAEECEGRVLPYELVAVVDDDTVAAELVRAAGAREDRPLYVNVDVPLDPGMHAVAVRFARVGRLPDSVLTIAPPLLQFRDTLVLGAKEIGLVTYDPDARSLVLVGYGR